MQFHGVTWGNIQFYIRYGVHKPSMTKARAEAFQDGGRTGEVGLAGAGAPGFHKIYISGIFWDYLGKL